MNATLTCAELKARIGEGAVVIDVMTPEDYAAGHVAGAVNACIYEMAFLERVAEQVPDSRTPLVVYDATGTTRAAELARERLLGAGYGDVTILAGGLAAWHDAGLPMATAEGADMAETALLDGTYRVDVGESRLEWIGRNLSKRHFGSIAIQAGELVVADSKPGVGSIVLDMATIDNEDLKDRFWHDLLLRHLKSDDFFAVERYPTATFALTDWEAQKTTSPEAPNWIATGDLTIKNVTRPLSFPAIVAPQRDGSIRAHAAFDINRTKWHVFYGSSSLFERLGMHLVHDMISLELFVLFRRS